MDTNNNDARNATPLASRRNLLTLAGVSLASLSVGSAAAAPAGPDSEVRLGSTVGAAWQSTAGGGFDRGHMVPNADRDKETSIPINQATFLMSNMSQQYEALNQGVRPLARVVPPGP